MRQCAPLLPDPGPKVIIECLDEIDRLHSALVTEEAVEAFASLAHQQWAGWMEYLFSKSCRNQDGSVTIPVGLVHRWEKQTATGYPLLPDDEKESDRTEAHKIIHLALSLMGRE